MSSHLPKIVIMGDDTIAVSERTGLFSCLVHFIFSRKLLDGWLLLKVESSDYTLIILYITLRKRHNDFVALMKC